MGQLSQRVHDYPLGTWAPPGYMFHYAVDSMYVQSAVQGTIAYSATLIMFIIGATILGWRCYAVNRNGPVAWIGLCIAGWSLATGVGSITMGAFNNSEVCVPFATLCGCVLALSAGSSRAAYLGLAPVRTRRSAYAAVHAGVPVAGSAPHRGSISVEGARPTGANWS